MLQIRDLHKSYTLETGEKIRVLEGVSFELHRREILGIIGRSGGGKSTLIRVLRGVEPFEKGEIWLSGSRITPDSPETELRKLREATALHLQRSFGLWEGTVLENLMRRLNALAVGDETAPLPPEDSNEYHALKKESEKLLRAVSLDQKATHPVHTLSGGEKQRLVLARQVAIATRRPTVLLLDEPVTMTCPATKYQAIDWIKNVRREFDVSIIVASHLPSLLKSLSDRVLWLEKKILNDGSAEEVIDSFLSQMDPPIPLTPPTKRKRVIIKVRELKKKYHAEVLKETFELKGVNFDVLEGEILAIIGPSGVGKTVFLRLMSGLELPDGGRVIYKLDRREIDITKLGYRAMAARRAIGRIHQEMDLPYHATVKELAMARVGLKGERVLATARVRARELGLREEVVDALYRLADYPEKEIGPRLETLGLDREVMKELFPLAPWEAISKTIEPTLNLCKLPSNTLERKTYELSWGERIRLAIALELLSRPKVLFLDEPFGDLDPVTLRAIANVLKLINRELGLTMVIVSHHLDFVREIAHRVILMKEGMIIQSGDPSEVIENFIRIAGAGFPFTEF